MSERAMIAGTGGVGLEAIRRLARAGLGWLASMVGAMGMAVAQPAQVLLLRHAEEPLGEEHVHLSPRGQERAQALASFLTTNAVFLGYGRPVAVYAPKFGGPKKSRRAYETVEPLARHLGLPVRQPYLAKDYAALVREVLADPGCQGKTVVICWVREYLPDLARSLGASSAPEGWKKQVFDRIWAIRFRQGEVAFARYPQRLLPGDSAD